MTTPTAPKLALPAASHTELFPGFWAPPTDIQKAQAAWHAKVESAPLGEQDRVYLQGVEQRSRKFIKGAVIWITIGAPLMWAGIAIAFSLVGFILKAL